MKKYIIAIFLIVGFIIPTLKVDAYNEVVSPILTLNNFEISQDFCHSVREDYFNNHTETYPYYLIFGQRLDGSTCRYYFFTEEQVNSFEKLLTYGFYRENTYDYMRWFINLPFESYYSLDGTLQNTDLFTRELLGSLRTSEINDGFTFYIDTNLDIKLTNEMLGTSYGTFRYNSLRVQNDNLDIIYNIDDLIIKDNQLSDGKSLSFEIPSEVEDYDEIFLNENEEVLIISPKNNNYNSNIYFPALFYLNSNFYNLDLQGNYTKNYYINDIETIDFTPLFYRLTFPENGLLVLDYKNFDENYIKNLPFFIKESDFNFYYNTRDLLLITSTIIDYKGETKTIDISEEIQKVIIEEDLQVEPERTIFSSLIEKLESTKNIIHDIYTMFYNSLPQGFQLLHNIILNVFCIVAIRKVLILR